MQQYGYAEWHRLYVASTNIHEHNTIILWLPLQVCERSSSMHTSYVCGSHFITSYKEWWCLRNYGTKYSSLKRNETEIMTMTIVYFDTR